MSKNKWMLIITLLFTSLACGLLANVQNGVQQIQSAATQLPGMLTAAPTMLGPMETAAAQFTPSSGSSSSGGPQNLSLANAKGILQMTQEFKFTDSTVDGQPASVATLSDSGVTTFPAMGTAYSAAFIGDPNNLSQIKMSAPRSDAQDTIDQAIGLDNVVLTGALPPTVQISVVTWLTENYAGVTDGGKMDKTFGTLQFSLERSGGTETLTVVPVK